MKCKTAACKINSVPQLIGGANAAEAREVDDV